MYSKYNNSYAIGIDLGTTYSCVGVYIDDKVKIITNYEGNKTTPSYVSFTETERLVGHAAKNIVARNPTNTIFDAKRLIGRKFDDPIVQKDMKLWPFKVESSPDGKPVMIVKHKGEMKKFHAEEISSMVLTKMKEVAETYLGKPVKSAVITVPAYFNDSQRQATKDAGFIAGLDVLRLINEPSAAAIAYGLDKQSKNEKNVLIFDLGGGTFDVSLLTLADGIFEVKATAGDTHLGGEDFDNKIVEYCAAEFMKKTGVNIRSNPRAMRRLKTQAEKAKRILSSSMQTTIEVDYLAEFMDYSTTIARAKFEELCMDYFKQCIPPVEKVLEDAGFLKNQIHDVVLVGGSSRIPKVIQLISDFFGKEPNRSINPDEAVAYGAAIQAAILTGQGSQNLRSVVLVDVAPFCLKIETAESVMGTFIPSGSANELTTLFPRGTILPATKNKNLTNYSNEKPDLLVQIYEGERQLTKDNKVLGKFNLVGIQSAPREGSQIEVTFDLDANGIMSVSAIEKMTGKPIIINDERRFSKDEIERMVKEAEKLKEKGEKIKKIFEKKHVFESYDENLKDIESHINEINRLLESNSILNQDKNENEKRQQQLQDLFNPIMIKIYQSQRGISPFNNEASFNQGADATQETLDEVD